MTGLGPKIKLALLVLVLALTTGCYREPVDELAVTKLSDEEIAERVFLPLNEDEPGTPIIHVQRFLAPGKSTVLFYFSPYSDDTAYFSERLERLTQIRHDICVRTININRPEIQEIDWDSPVIHDAEIPSLPYFRIYDSQKRLRSHGRPALEQITRWMKYHRLY